MLLVPESIEELLRTADASNADLDEEDFSFQIEGELNGLKDLTPEQQAAGRAEVNAFQFTLTRKLGLSSWGTRFGPYFDATIDGQVRATHSIRGVDSAVLDHWASRARPAKHPVMRARYADLLWDLTKAVNGGGRPADMARLAVDAYVESATRFPETASAEVRLARAFEVAKQVNYKEGVDAAQVGMFRLLDVNPEKRWRHEWLFDQVFSDLGLAPSPEQMQLVITGLEATLEDICSTENPCGLTAQDPALRLAAYYEKEKRTDDLKRVMRRYGGAVIHMAMGASQYVPVFWLQDLYALYVKFGMKDETDEILTLMKEKSKEGYSQMREISVPVEFTKEELEAFIQDFIGHGDLEHTLFLIAFHFIPRQEDLLQRVEEFKKVAPTVAMMQVTNATDEQVVSQIGSMHSDTEGHMLSQMYQDVSFRSGFLRKVLERAEQEFKYTTENILEIFLRSPIFDHRRAGIIQCGLDAYFAACDGDSHLRSAN